jgi:hypothetical protein
LKRKGEILERNFFFFFFIILDSKLEKFKNIYIEL